MTVQFNFPTTILYGPGSVRDLAARLARSNPRGPVLLVTDPGLVEAGIAPRVRDVFEDAGVAIEVFDAVHPNPLEADVVAGAQRFREAGCAAVVGLGGGSPLDAAKVIAVLGSHEGSLLDFDALSGGDERIDGERLPPIYGVPTTAGTGSEVGRSAVIVAEATGRKTIVFHPRLMPRIAALDPERDAAQGGDLAGALPVDLGDVGEGDQRFASG